jgi:hypothetical protein
VIEGYRIMKSAHTSAPEMFFEIDFHEQSIKCLKWLIKRPNNDGDKDDSEHDRFLCAASSDLKLTFYKLAL